MFEEELKKKIREKNKITNAQDDKGESNDDSNNANKKNEFNPLDNKEFCDFIINDWMKFMDKNTIITNIHKNQDGLIDIEATIDEFEKKICYYIYYEKNVKYEN
jgi:hypothetical protein